MSKIKRSKSKRKVCRRRPTEDPRDCLFGLHVAATKHLFGDELALFHLLHLHLVHRHWPLHRPEQHPDLPSDPRHGVLRQPAGFRRGLGQEVQELGHVLQVVVYRRGRDLGPPQVADPPANTHKELVNGDTLTSYRRQREGARRTSGSFLGRLRTPTSGAFPGPPPCGPRRIGSGTPSLSRSASTSVTEPVPPGAACRTPGARLERNRKKETKVSVTDDRQEDAG